MKELGNCPICGRIMIAGNSVNKHHFIPQCKGGKLSENLHRICHRKIHSLFTEKELEKIYNHSEIIIANEEMQKFIKWVASKEPTFYDRSFNKKKK